MSPKATTHRQAFALANLIGLGFAPTRAVSLSTEWMEQRIAQATQNVLDLASRVAVSDAIGKSNRGHLFASFHMSLYPAIFHALAHQNDSRNIYSLLGSQPKEHQTLLTELGRAIAINVRFIHSGPSMLRQIRTALSGGTHVIVLVDIPWSPNQAKSDISFPAPFGAFLGYSTLERLLLKIDPDYRVVSAFGPSTDVQLIEFDRTSLASAFGIFGELVAQHPEQYERLNKLHHFCNFIPRPPALITYKESDRWFAIHSHSMTLLQVGSGQRAVEQLFQPGEHRHPNDLVLATKIAGRPVDAVISL